MLRHIISVSLAMAACASLIPTKANAISFTLTPLGGLQRNRDERISFVVRLDPQNDGGLGGVEIEEVFQPSAFFNPRSGTYDSNELSFIEVLPLFNFGEQPVTRPRDIAAIIFKVTNPIKDGAADVSAGVRYRIGNEIFEQLISDSSKNSPLDVQPVPEPLTILGAATAIGYGALLKRKSSKKTVS